MRRRCVGKCPTLLRPDMLIAREYRLATCFLFLGEQPDTGVQGAANLVERVACASAMPEGVLLDALPASVQCVTGEADDVERIHHGALVDPDRGDTGEPVRVIDQRRLPSAMIALFAACQDTRRPAATRVTVRWSTTIPVSAQVIPRWLMRLHR